MSSTIETARPERPAGGAFWDVHSAEMHEKETEMPAVTGKRYRCPKCGAEFIVTRGSDDAELRHDDTPLEQL